MTDRNMKTSRFAIGQSEGIRRYSMTWLLRAACRVNERGMQLHDEHRRLVRHNGVNGLFDLSDADRSGNYKRLS